MSRTALFTKEDQKELRRLKKQEKEGKDINWSEILTKRYEKGNERWKRYGK